MRRSLLVLGLLCTAACNVVSLRQNSLEAGLREAELRGRQVRAGEHSVYVWEGGPKKPALRPVLLIHGFGASGVWQWAAQATDLARDRRVIMPDLLWFGATVPAGRDFSISAQVEMMADLLEALDLESVDVVGISYGGLVANELACRHPERVARLVLVDSPARSYTHADYEALLKRLGSDDLAKVMVPSDVEGIDRLLELAYENPPWSPRWAKVQALETIYREHRVEQVEVLRSAVGELDRMELLPGRVIAPALVIWGRNDQIFPLELGQRVAASLGAKLVIIEAARHFVPAEQPAQLNRALREFLTGP